MRPAIVLLCLAITGCCLPFGSPPPPPVLSPPGALSPLPPPPATAAVGAATARVELVHANGPLSVQLAREAASARARGLRPVAAFHASWCPPCRAVDRYADDPSMIAAFRGVALIRIDIDEWSGEEQESAGLQVIGVPTWIALDDAGRATEHRISSDAWGPDIPANMAPVLDRFFHGGPTAAL